jgi:hypothetical protein
MELRAPVAVPVEIRAEVGRESRRAFRLAQSVGEDGVRLVRPAPFEPGRPVEIALALPDGPVLRLSAEVLHADSYDEKKNEGTGGRELTFFDVPSDARAALRGYVRSRLGLPS